MSALSRRDQSDLEKALSIGVFEKSIMGSILDRAELYSTAGRARDPGPFCGAVNPGRPPPARVTAVPTAEVRYSPKSEPDSRLLEVYGRASRKLARLSAADPVAAAALVAYHGDAGAKWGRGEHGRICAVVHLTRAGKKLMRRARSRGAKLQISDAERLEVEIGMQSTTAATESRRDMLAAAIGEAITLYQRACAKWNLINGVE